MTVPSRQAVASLLLAAAAIVSAQTPITPLPRKLPGSPIAAARPATPYINHNLIFLDPAHGGADPGAHLADTVLEKDVTLALATRIRLLLAGNNLSVVLARETDGPTAPADADPGAPPAIAPLITSDGRAGAANHLHPVACILLHATASGNGVHIVTSALPPPPDTSFDPPAPPSRALRWDSAQTDSLPQSLRLANEIGTAIARANLPVHLSRASVKPIDSLTCPAVAVEIAPLISGPTQVTDPAYQQRVAQAIATALLFWRGHADPPLPPRSPTDPASPTGAQP